MLGGPITALVLGAAAGEASAQRSPIVNTTLGPVRGTTGKDGVSVWRGIPFAAPPVGRNRFHAPRPATPWAEVRPAQRDWGASCPQIGVLGSEDCLYLHVAAPARCTAAAPCAVLFWIFGGAFEVGSADEFGWYDPRELAEREGVVVVAPNYRVGALGFLALGALQRESGGTVGSTRPGSPTADSWLIP